MPSGAVLARHRCAIAEPSGCGSRTRLAPVQVVYSTWARAGHSGQESGVEPSAG